MRLTSLLGVLAFTSINASVTDCSKGASLFKIDSMSFSPDPAIKGQNSTLLVSSTVPEQITGGTAKYSIKYSFIPLTPTIEDLCKAVSCPIMVGKLDTVSSYPIDKSLSGSITIQIDWADQTGRQLLCVLIQTKITEPFNL
jgi:hypothetical protein